MQREIEIFGAALERRPGEREAFLRKACGEDAPLRNRIEALLATHAAASGFIPELEATVRESGVREELGRRIGHYKLLEEIGKGGCGVVYVAEQTEPVRRRVALKVIKLGMDTKAVVARFEAERQALAMLDHPNIAKVLDAGTTETGRPYFVMELVRGICITDYCDQVRLSTRERLDLFIKVCQAIQHAHQKGIIHRDIKPSNILVTLHDGVPVPKVIDFGIAKATEGRLTDKTVYTQLRQFIGTPAYMSPEQAEMSGLDIDTRSDIYSLGVLLYELLAGKPPFDGQELVSMGLDAMRRTIRETEPLRPSTRLSQELVAADLSPRKTTTGLAVPTQAEVSADARRRLRLKEQIARVRGDLDWIVMKCLEKDRSRRYDTANGLAADLKRHLDNEPVVARPPSTVYRFQKACRRNQLVFAAAGAVAAALLIGAAVSLWQAIRASRAEREQNQLRQMAVQALEGETAQRKTAESEHQRAQAEAKKALASQRQAQRLLYAADMNLAQQSLKKNNLGRASRLLDRHRPRAGEEDFRGWEWRYLWQQTRGNALVTLTNRPARGYSVSFSPDGHRLAVGWFDGHVDLWDVPGRRLVRTLTEHGSNPYYPGRAAFSPVRNLLVATAAYKVVTLYDLDSGRETTLWRAPEEGWWTVRDLSFSSDGSKLAIYAGSTPDHGAAVWIVNVASAKIEKRCPTLCGTSWHYGAAQLSPHGRLLYLARSDPSAIRYSIQCLDLATDRELWRTESLKDGGVATLALSPDGRVLASGSGYNDPRIRLWDTATGRLLRQLEGHDKWVCKLVFSPDGRRLISAASDQTIRFWDTGTGSEIRVLRGHRDEVHAVAISPTAPLLASASKDGDLMLWNAEEQSAAGGYRRLPGTANSGQVFPLDHSRLLLLSPGQSPQTLDLKGDGAPTPRPELGASSNVLGCFGANLVFTWNGTNQILAHEWRGSEFSVRGAITLKSGRRPTVCTSRPGLRLVALSYHPARQLLAWSEPSSSNSVQLASLTTPGRRLELKNDVGGVSEPSSSNSVQLASLTTSGRRLELKSDVGGVHAISFSKDGKHLAAANGDSVWVWNLASGKIVVSIDELIGAITFAAGGRVLFVGLKAGTDILFYDLTRPNAPPRRLPGKFPCWSLAVSPDGTLVAAATVGGEVLLFRAANGKLMELLHGHMNAVINCAFSPDGQRLISTSANGREVVKLWDVSTRQELLTLDGVRGYGLWSTDGDAILVKARRLQVWRAPSWEEIAAAEAQEKTETRQP